MDYLDNHVGHMGCMDGEPKPGDVGGYQRSRRSINLLRR